MVHWHVLLKKQPKKERAKILKFSLILRKQKDTLWRLATSSLRPCVRRTLQTKPLYYKLSYFYSVRCCRFIAGNTTFYFGRRKCRDVDNVISTSYKGGFTKMFKRWSINFVSTWFYNVKPTSINKCFFHVESKLILWPQRCFTVDQSQLYPRGFKC